MGAHAVFLSRTIRNIQGISGTDTVPIADILCHEIYFPLSIHAHAWKYTCLLFPKHLAFKTQPYHIIEYTSSACSDISATGIKRGKVGFWFWYEDQNSQALSNSTPG